jgi:hypothetical protein
MASTTRLSLAEVLPKAFVRFHSDCHNAFVSLVEMDHFHDLQFNQAVGTVEDQIEIHAKHNEVAQLT